jgi:hypothetical protein
MPLTPKDHYTLLLKTFRAEGLTILHRPLKEGGGHYNPTTTKITISSEYRNTLKGCSILCHEYHHYKQNRYNEFPEFFNLPRNMKFDQKTFDLILAAEMDAVKGANLTLKMFGIPFVCEELSPEGQRHAEKFWREYYFGKG